MACFKVAEIFTSINGEGTKAGQPAVFVRFAGCNLNCSYCDTKWANEPDADFKLMDSAMILDTVKKTGIKNITLTGGEPLLREGMYELLKLIADDSFLEAEIETNGSVDLKGFSQIRNRPSFTMDYKLPSSGMEDFMLTENFSVLGSNDTVKFVSGSMADLERALEIIKRYRLTDKCHVYISPVFGSIEPERIVGFMIENKMNGINLQLQLHKIIWNPDMRGV
ncbi:putative 7-carboxy-7-deazaguanine synthase QueE [Lachnospiraceae bacterium NSJ-143]|nr:putative 7-carboxy-7-deazaguanine synthase QueE [Lachnospiraceae bacterium NSJ-143]